MNICYERIFETGRLHMGLIVVHENFIICDYTNVIVSEPALKQCRNIARQYAYFTNLFQVSTI